MFDPTSPAHLLRRISASILALLVVNESCVSGAQTGGTPNILFAIADDWGAHAGVYGTPWVKTPNFDRVARSGILFRNAFTPNAKCAPSRACILSGRNPWQLGAAANHICYFPPEFKGWPEVLSTSGWNVGFTAKGWGPGTALDASGKQRLLTGKAWNRHQCTPPTKGMASTDYAGNFREFLDAAPGNTPWCFWYGGLEPHRGYEYGSGVTLGGKKLSDIARVPGFWPDTQEVRTDMLDYALEVEYFDLHLGRMIELLESRNLLQNTVIVVTSDHGMPFPRSKGNSNPTANHVPLAVMWGKGIRNPGRIVDDFVSFVDVAPTILDCAGVPAGDSGMAPVSGRSIRPLFESSEGGQVDPQRDHVLIGRERNDVGRPGDAGYPVRGIITRTHCYLENCEPARWPQGNPETGYLDCDASPTKSLILARHREDSKDAFWHLCFGLRPAIELYDRGADPDCIQNLAQTADFFLTREKLARMLHAELKREADPREEGKGGAFDLYPHANKNHAGFYERFLAGEKMKTPWVADTDYEPASADAPGVRPKSQPDR